MTRRSIVLGLFGALLICGITYFNDHVIRQGYLIGSILPAGVYGGVILMVLLLNPLLARVKKSWALSGRELAVAMAITLAACCIPSAGLLETFPDTVMMPHQYARTEAGWQDSDILGLAPPDMLAHVEGNESRALNGYITGLSEGSSRTGWREVPWSAWGRTLAYWLPLALILWVGLIGLSVVVHRQWSSHEQLPYPIAQFSNALLPEEGATKGRIFSGRYFWWGAGLVLTVHIWNYTGKVWPQYMVAPFPLVFDFTPLSSVFPVLWEGGGGGLFHPRVIFTIIALGFLLPSETSFSMGIGPFLYYAIAGLLAIYGISTTSGGYVTANIRSSLQAGGWIGIMVVIIYTGRRYYGHVIRRALGLTCKDDVELASVYGARVFGVCTITFTLMLIVSGLDWMLAIVFVLLTVGIFLVIGRLAAETGYPFIQPYWMPTALMVGFVGLRGLGPSTIVLLGLFSTVFLVDTREALTPLLLNSFKVLDERKIRIGKTAVWCGVALVLGLGVAVPVTLHTKYDRGTDKVYTWASERVPKMAFDHALAVQTRLEAQGDLEQVESISGFRRLLAMRPQRTVMIAFFGALTLVFVLSVLRFRIKRWPLHPVFLLVWATYAGVRFAWPFLIGCAVKVCVVKYGGDRMFQKVKPLMFGLLAGDLVFGALMALGGGAYYLLTGETPPLYQIWAP